jgi:IS605 OrfB family transposase
VERAVSEAPAPLEAVGIDLGLKDTAATSDGDKLLAGQFYRGIEQRISLAQRHGHKRQAKRLHRTAARRRKDALHKFSGQIVGKYQQIIIGDVSSLKLAKTRMAKSVLDAGWGMLKAQLKYKGEYAGRCVLIIDERNTTRTCSSCRALTGPSGLDRLVVRRWVCSGCGVTHDRDVNAARNILFAGVSWKLETISSEAIAKMGVGPSESPFRRRLQTAHCCDGRKSMVVSEWVKYAAKLREVGVGKMSESKPPMTYREDVIVVKTGGAADLHDQCMGSSDYCVHGNRYTGGMSPMQALLWNHENLPDDAKGKRRAADTASTNTDASGRGGVTCSSDEGSVTDPERRGHSVQKMQSVNRPSDGRNR